MEGVGAPESLKHRQRARESTPTSSPSVRKGARRVEKSNPCSRQLVTFSDRCQIETASRVALGVLAVCQRSHQSRVLRQGSKATDSEPPDVSPRRTDQAAVNPSCAENDFDPAAATRWAARLTDSRRESRHGTTNPMTSAGSLLRPPATRQPDRSVPHGGRNPRRGRPAASRVLLLRIRPTAALAISAPRRRSPTRRGSAQRGGTLTKPRRKSPRGGTNPAVLA
jgi:hypothetical protein